MYISQQENLSKRWGEECGRNIFRATMFLQFFEIIRAFLRFDSKESRVNLRRLDKLAATRSLFDLFVTQLPKMFIPYGKFEWKCWNEIIEQLVLFRGKCPLRKYISSTPREKYEIKTWLMSDFKTIYVCAAEIYAGKSSDGERGKFQVRNVALHVINSIVGTARNTTVNNFFTNYILAKELLKKKLNIIGTLRKNTQFIPSEFYSSREWETFPSLFGFQLDIRLLSCMTEKNR